MRVSRSEKNPFRPYLTCRRRDSCKYFQWADEEPHYSFHYQQSQPQVFMKAMNYQPGRPKLQRQFAVIEDVKKDIPPLYQVTDKDTGVSFYYN